MLRESREQSLQVASPPFSVFISYAHRDDNDQDRYKRFVYRLQRQWPALTRDGRVKAFSDKEIELGDDWHKRLLDALESASVAVLLVGPEFYLSEFISKTEVPLILERADAGLLTVIPIILSPCRFQDTFFRYPCSNNGPNRKSLAHFQSANPPTNPLIQMSELEQENLFLRVAQFVQSLVDESSIPVDVPKDTDEQVRAVEGALDLLSDLVRTSQTVREAVQHFRSAFEAASANAERFRAFKELHEVLHCVQLRCLDLIAVELPVFGGDTSSGERLDGPEQDLQEAIAKISAGGVTWSRFGFGTTLLANDLISAHTDLRNALDHADSAYLRKAYRRLERTINNYPGMINSLLLGAAEGLSLPALVQAMDELQSCLITLRVMPDQLREFVEGLQSLTALSLRLTGLLFEHNGWQIAENEMQMFQFEAENPSESLKSFWPELKARTELLYRDHPAQLAKELEAGSERLEEALTSQNISGANRAYRRFRRAARLRFYQVDGELLDLCSSLVEVGASLENLIRRLDPVPGRGNVN